MGNKKYRIVDKQAVAYALERINNLVNAINSYTDLLNDRGLLLTYDALRKMDGQYRWLGSIIEQKMKDRCKLMGISYASICKRGKTGVLENEDLWRSVAEEDEPLRQIENTLAHVDKKLMSDKCLFLDNNMAAVADGALEYLMDENSWYFEEKSEIEAYKRAAELKALIDKLGFDKATLTDILDWDNEISVHGVIQYARHLQNKMN